MGLISKKRTSRNHAGALASEGLSRKGSAKASFSPIEKRNVEREGDSADVLADASVVCSSRWGIEGAPLHNVSRDELVALLPFPSSDANKYTRGKLTLVAGSDRYPGAACLAALAAARMGAGYIEAVAPAQMKPLLVSSSPSIVVTSRKKWDAQTAFPADVKGHLRAVCIGPGFDPEDDETENLVLDVLRNAPCPVLVDGGALSVLVTKKGRRLLKRRFERGWSTVVTPHAGEAARLAKPFDLPCDIPSRLATLLSLAYGVVVVLKGPDTFVSDGDRTYVVTEGTPDLAKAGTGDVLAGMTASLLAQGVSPVHAGVLAATLHAFAGRAAGRRYTSFGVRAEDVAEQIPQAIIELIG